MNALCRLCYKRLKKRHSQVDAMQQQIKDLCSELLRAKDPNETEAIGENLRSAIHDHIENLRHDVMTLPMLETVFRS